MPEPIDQTLDRKYAEGWFAVITTHTQQIIIRHRDNIRGTKGGVLIRRGRTWDFSPAY